MGQAAVAYAQVGIQCRSGVAVFALRVGEDSIAHMLHREDVSTHAVGGLKSTYHIIVTEVRSKAYTLSLHCKRKDKTIIIGGLHGCSVGRSVMPELMWHPVLYRLHRQDLQLHPMIKTHPKP